MTGADENAGCAYVYKWNTTTSAWDLDGTLFPQINAQTYDHGQRVSISNGKVYVSNAQNHRVYQYRRVGPGNWVLAAAVSILSIVATVIAVRQALDVNTNRAVLVCVIAMLVGFAFAVALGTVLGVGLGLVGTDPSHLPLPSAVPAPEATIAPTAA